MDDYKFFTKKKDFPLSSVRRISTNLSPTELNVVFLFIFFGLARNPNANIVSIANDIWTNSMDTDSSICVYMQSNLIQFYDIIYKSNGTQHTAEENSLL